VAHDGPVYSLVSNSRQLISSGTGDIKGWNWNDLIKKGCKEAWNRRPAFGTRLDIPEINSLVLNQKDNSLLMACGDNTVQVMDLENGVFTQTLNGHQDYVHCVALRDQHRECVSGSEDGTVRLWDLRTATQVQAIEVYKYEECTRPQRGKWIACLCTDSNWLVCGGGPALSLWHLRSVTPTTVYPLQGSQLQAMFYQDLILTAGDGPVISHCQVSGDVKTEVPCTPASVYSLRINERSQEHKVLTAAGSSNKIDVFTNFGYRAFSLRFT
ncbi:THO complex subunit 6 homolog, partial [Rhincodon typus]|uniref:THO complex subunit 6 homolog n=1 Tax=Rhincodon typus TaxID=259920 RepID=UPI0020304A86